MEINKILFLTIVVVIYIFLTLFVSKIITKKLKKEAIAEDNFNYYTIILCALLVSASFFGKEITSVSQDVYLILSKNQATKYEFLRIISIFCFSGILMNVISYFFAFTLLNFVFEKIKIIEKYNTDQYGYFLFWAILIVMLSFLFSPIYNQMLIFFSPKLEIGLFN